MTPNLRIFNHVRQNDKIETVFCLFLRIIHNKTVMYTTLKRNSTVLVLILCTQSDFSETYHPFWTDTFTSRSLLS